MLKAQLAAGLAATALTAGSALAQTSPAPTQPAGSGQIMTQMTPGLMRGSLLVGVDVYGAGTQKIGDIDEVLVGQGRQDPGCCRRSRRLPGHWREGHRHSL